MNKDIERSGYQIYFSTDGLRVFLVTFREGSLAGNSLIAFDAAIGTVLISVSYTDSAHVRNAIRSMLMGEGPEFPTYICNWIATAPHYPFGLLILKFRATKSGFSPTPIWAIKSISSSNSLFPLGLVFGDTPDILYSFAYFPTGTLLVASRVRAVDG